MSARKAFNRGLEGIDELYERAVKWEATHEKKRQREVSETVKMWLQSEQTFPRNIVIPFPTRPPDKLPVYL